MSSGSSVPFEPPERPAPPLDRTLVEAFLAHVPDFVFFKDAASHFIAVSHSKAHRHGCEPEDMLGLSDADFFTADHARAARADEEEIMASGKPRLARLEHTAFRDGREAWTEVSKLPLRDEQGAVVGTFGLCTDVTETQTIKLELEQALRELTHASRLAGMAEVATGVLHNVGNVLTSVNVAAGVLASGLAQSKAASLERVSELLQSHAGDLGHYLTADPKGRLVPEFIASLGRHWLDERERLRRELSSLQQSIDHIKEIVGMQQACHTTAGTIALHDPAQLMEDALRMNAGSLERHEVRCVREFAAAPPVRADKSKVLQILINLIRNAKFAVVEGGASPRVVTVRIGPGDGGRVRLVVTDNGIGIPARNLGRIFTHGFTTRPGGHGFGLHSSLAAARAMDGDLTAHSDGPGSGATFTLELPAG